MTLGGGARKGDGRGLKWGVGDWVGGGGVGWVVGLVFGLCGGVWWGGGGVWGGWGVVGEEKRRQTTRLKGEDWGGLVFGGRGGVLGGGLGFGLGWLGRGGGAGKLRQ